MAHVYIYAFELIFIMRHRIISHAQLVAHNSDYWLC